MKNTFKWMFAAILVCGLTVSSSMKEPVEKKTVLAGMTTTSYSIGIPPLIMTYDYNYTVDTEGHIATCEVSRTSRSTKYVLNREER